MNAKLFINYRREDTGHAAGRLYDRLIAHFGEDQVFIDIDQIEPGEDFVEVINRKVGACDIAIVAIGPNWLHTTNASGKRRLDDEEDFVRMEIVAALQRKIRVIPVLVGGARMPGRHDLPEALTPLSRRNAIELSETRFHPDVNRLIEAIERSFAAVEKKTELPATPVAPLPEPAAVRPPEPESKDFPEPSESTKPAEAKETKEIDASTISGAAPVSPGEPTKQFPTQAAPPYRESERSQQGSVATAQDSTAPVKPTETTQSQTAIPPVASISAITALQGLKVWASERWIIVGATVLLLLLLVGFLILSSHQNAADEFDLGSRYQYGKGVPEDSRKAAELYQKAADKGYAPGQCALGGLYERGEGVPKDLGKAAELYQKAADQGHNYAQFKLGRLYEIGEGVPKDSGKAAQLYQKVGDQGDWDAQCNLGGLYERGEGVPKDLEKARALYQKAADRGSEKALTQLKALLGDQK
jgi:TPR repeat protein